jgi:hypothetical protein
MQSGDTKRGAGHKIYLLTNGAEVDSMTKRLCADYRSSDAAVVRHARAIRDSMFVGGLAGFDAIDKRMYRLDLRAERITKTLRGRVDSVIAAHIADSVKAGLDAHYRFDRVAPGQYILYGTWPVGRHSYRWWAPVELKAGEEKRIDLDNDAERGQQLNCDEADDPILGR